MYNVILLSPDSGDGPGDGPGDVSHACVLHSLSSVVGLGHAIPPCAAGVVVVHVLVCIPVPHGTLHGL